MHSLFAINFSVICNILQAFWSDVVGGIAAADPLCKDTGNRVGFESNCGLWSLWLGGGSGLLSLCTPCPVPLVYPMSRRVESQSLALSVLKAHDLNLYSTGSLGETVSSHPLLLWASRQHSQPQVARVILASRGLPLGRRQQTINPFGLKFCEFNVFPIQAESAISKGEMEQE